MLGDAAGPRVGSHAYNLFHTYYQPAPESIAESEWVPGSIVGR